MRPAAVGSSPPLLSTVNGIATAHQPHLLDRELVVVTGKGGVGKTTVAAAIALLGAHAGRRTIVCEVSGQRRIPGLLGHPTAGGPGREEAVGADLWATTVDPEGALAEWAGQVVRPRAVVELAVRSKAFSGFVAAAPGARELVTITKAWELGRADRWRPGAAGYDLVVLDAPASGHGLGLLRTPHTYAEIARVGPIANQARLVTGLLADPRRCAVVAVATAEETPVGETLELQDALEQQFGRVPEAFIANGVLRDPLSSADAAVVGAVADGTHPAVIAALRARRERSRTQAQQLRRLRRGARAPVVTLPFLPGGAFDPGAIEALAGELRRRL